MTASTLSLILRDPFYAGQCRESGMVYQGSHTPMISMEEHRRVLDLLKRLERVQPKRHEFAYTGTLYCGNCGRLFTAYEVVKQSGNSYIYYKCRVCPGETIRETTLQEQLDEYAATIKLPAPAFMVWAKEVIERYGKESGKRDEAVASQRAVSVAALDNQLKNLLTALTTELISSEEFATERQLLLDRRQSLQEDRQRISLRHECARDAAANVLMFISNVQNWLHHPTPGVRRACARALGSNFRIRSKKVLLELHPLLAELEGVSEVLAAKCQQFELTETYSETTKNDRLVYPRFFRPPGELVSIG